MSSDQITDLSTMTPEEITQALTDGRLRTLLTGEAPTERVPVTGALDGRHTPHMTPEEIVRAHTDGRFAGYLSEPNTA